MVECPSLMTVPLPALLPAFPVQVTSQFGPRARTASICSERNHRCPAQYEVSRATIGVITLGQHDTFGAVGRLRRIYGFWSSSPWVCRPYPSEVTGTEKYSLFIMKCQVLMVWSNPPARIVAESSVRGWDHAKYLRHRLRTVASVAIIDYSLWQNLSLGADFSQWNITSYRIDTPKTYILDRWELLIHRERYITNLLM